MKGFARVTKLTNIGGRADYISNPIRQERIVAKSESVDWKPYQDYERSHQMTYKRNNEGREIIVMLPNEWHSLPEQELKARAQSLAEVAVGKKTDLQWAVHWNSKQTNLHMHIIFSERVKTEPKRWDRDIYLTDDGKVAKRKADRAKNPDGSFKPPVHRKGDLQGGFSVKDTEYKKKSWSYAMKKALKMKFMEYGVQIEPKGLLNEYHEGKGKDSAVIREKNERIRETNRLAEIYFKKFPELPKDLLKKLAYQAMQDGYVLKIFKMDEKFMKGSMTLEQAREYRCKLLQPTRSERLKQAHKEFVECNEPYLDVYNRLKNLKKPPFFKKKEMAAYNVELERLNVETSHLKELRDKAIDEMAELGVDMWKSAFKSYTHLEEAVKLRCDEMDHEDSELEKRSSMKKQESKYTTQSSIKDEIQRQRNKALNGRTTGKEKSRRNSSDREGR